MSPKPVTNLPLEHMRELYLAGESIITIAKAVQAHYTTVHVHLARMGIMRTRSEAAVIKCKSGRATWPQGSMEKSPGWKGGRRTVSPGYIQVKKPDHPRADPNGYVFEHLLVWEQHHRRPLPKGWVVHHRDGVKNNNSPANLVAYTVNRHAAVHAEIIRENGKLRQRIDQLEAEVAILKKLLEKTDTKGTANACLGPARRKGADVQPRLA